MEDSPQDTASSCGSCEAGDRGLPSETPELDCFGEGRPLPPLPTTPNQLLASEHNATATPETTFFRASLPRSRSLPQLPTPPTSEISVPPDTIAESTPPCAPKAPFVRGHRRRSTHVDRRDLEKFRKEVLGVETTGFEYDDEGALTANPKEFQSQLEELNRAFDAATMSLNSSGSNSSGSGMFSNYTDNSAAGPSNLPSVPRQPIPSPMATPPPQVNGGGMAGINGGVPMSAGHQMDLRHLFDMVLELSDVLKNNRDMTKSIVSSAEDIMVCFLAPLHWITLTMAETLFIRRN